VADDNNGALYVSQEDVGLRRYNAEPGADTTSTFVDTVGANGRLVPDVEGVTIVGNYLIASAQNVANPQNSYFTVYNRTTNAYVDAFRIVEGATTDGCSRTDGITAYGGNLGSDYPNGMFICQDNFNNGVGPDGNQNFKLTRLETVLP
jgi:3-phytase